MIDDFDAMTVAALSESLKKNQSIPNSLAQKVNEVAQTLVHDLKLGNSSRLYVLIDELEKNHPNIYEFYGEEFTKIQEPDHTQERNKALPPDEKTERELPLYLRNFCANCDFLKTIPINKNQNNTEESNQEKYSDLDRDNSTYITPPC